VEASDLPKEEKERRKRAIKAEVVQELAREHDRVQAIARKEKVVQELEIRRYQAKWDSERKRRANYVASVTGATVIEADALINRAAAKGWDYDTVDWDQLQGRDLSYADRLERLERMVGATTTSKGAYGYEDIDWAIEKYEEEYAEWLQEEKRRRKLSEEEEEAIWRLEQGVEA
jgi:hypothetical protein